MGHTAAPRSQFWLLFMSFRIHNLMRGQGATKAAVLRQAMLRIPGEDWYCLGMTGHQVILTSINWY